MIKVIKQIIKRIYSFPFIWNSVGRFFRSDGVIVLMYHRIGDEHGIIPGFEVEKFTEQMVWIKNNCNVIHPDDFKNSVHNNKKYKPNVLITFDDGYRCCYKYAYPVLKKLSLPALVFLATQPPDEGGFIWTDRLNYLISLTHVKRITLPWSSEVFELDSSKNKKELLNNIKSYLKNIDNLNRVNYLKELEKLFNVELKGKVERQMLTWDEVRDSLNVVSYGGHTHTHPIMSRVSKNDLEAEISLCRDRIYTETGIYPKSFAYPNGTTVDYNDLCIDLLKKYGYELAYTTNEGLNDIDTNLMEIKRVPTGANNIEDFVWLLSTAGCK
ncbi:MAG: polysaccharide deacetylase family protein [Thiohalomonadales bacterium]